MDSDLFLQTGIQGFIPVIGYVTMKDAGFHMNFRSLHTDRPASRIGRVFVPVYPEGDSSFFRFRTARNMWVRTDVSEHPMICAISSDDFS